MSDEKKLEQEAPEPAEQELKTRRDFLKSLGRWSSIIIGAAALGGLMPPEDAAGWVNGHVGWVNARGGWINGGCLDQRRRWWRGLGQSLWRGRRRLGERTGRWRRLLGESQRLLEPSRWGLAGRSY